MKKKKFRLHLIVVIMMFLTTSSFAQFKQLGNVLAAGTDDAEKIFKAYLSPYASGMGAGLSTGWYNTAKSHKFGGFDVTFSLNMAIIPSADKTFDPALLGLGEGSDLISSVNIDGESPTAAGDKVDGAEVIYNTNIPGVGEVPFARFNLPKGTGFGYVPAPMIQFGIGLVKETDLIIRYSPDIEWGNGSKIGLWGIGLKHSIKQWIPALNKLPVFDLSLQGGYTKLHSKNSLNFQASFYEGFADIIVDNPTFYSGQKMLLDVRNTTFNLIFSGDFKVICLYGGVGISSTKSNLQLTGFYPLPEVQGTQIIVTDETATVKDPIDISIKSSDGSITKPRFNAGLRFKFAIVTLHFDYTYANYSVASAGIGFAFR